MKIGLFPICGDILHAGHLMALEEAKDNCDYLIVALNTHPDGKKPIQSVFERFTQLDAVKFIDKIIPYQGKADLELLASCLNYQVRFIGDDYMNKPWDGQLQEAKRGIQPYYIKRSQHFLSSTNIKNRIADNVINTKVVEVPI